MAHVAKEYDEALRRRVEEIINRVERPEKITEKHVKEVLELVREEFKDVPKDAWGYLLHVGAANAVKGLVDESLEEEEDILDTNALTLYLRILHGLGKIRRIPRSEDWHALVVSALRDTLNDLRIYQEAVEEQLEESAEAGHEEAVKQLRNALGEILVTKSHLFSTLVNLGALTPEANMAHLTSVLHYAHLGLIPPEKARGAIEAAQVGREVKDYLLKGLKGAEDALPIRPKAVKPEKRSGSRLPMSL